MMNYVTYFDLLGTRGFCDDPVIYYNNITYFYKSIEQISYLIGDEGSIGVFSDCAYAECSDLAHLLDFVVYLRDRLMAKGLFFNAYVSKGDLRIENIPSNNKSLYGTCFKNPSITKLYIAQSKFKGVGISLDKSVRDELSKLMNDDGSIKYRVNRCIYINREVGKDGDYYSPVAYFDIGFGESRYGDRQIINKLNTVLKAFYASYIKSPRYGSYYISIFSNLVASYSNGFKWDSKNDCFSTWPLVFRVLNKMIKERYEALADLPGLDYLAFYMINAIYDSGELNRAERIDMTKEFVKLPFFKKYTHSLEIIPGAIFSDKCVGGDEDCDNNRDLFIRYCQTDLSEEFADGLMSNLP